MSVYMIATPSVLVLLLLPPLAPASLRAARLLGRLSCTLTRWPRR